MKDLKTVFSAPYIWIVLALIWVAFFTMIIAGVPDIYFLFIPVGGFIGGLWAGFKTPD